MVPSMRRKAKCLIAGSVYFRSYAVHVLTLKNAIKLCLQRVERVHRGRVPNIPDDIRDIIRKLFYGCEFRNIMPHSHAFEYEYPIKERLIFEGEDMADKRKKKRKIRNLGITNAHSSIHQFYVQFIK